MISPDKDSFLSLKNSLSKEKKIAAELGKLAGFLKNPDSSEEKSISGQISSLKEALKSENERVSKILGSINLNRTLDSMANMKKVDSVMKSRAKTQEENPIAAWIRNREARKKFPMPELDREVMQRIEKRRVQALKGSEKKPRVYANISSRIFSDISRALAESKGFKSLVENLQKTNMEYVPAVYISVIMSTTFLVFAFSVVIFLFFLFFKIGLVPPSIAPVTDMISRFTEIFWVLIVLPAGTFALMYFYPSLERGSLEDKINQELPFATINMSAIAGSMIDPTNIFSIMVSTGEYPNIRKQFTKVINEINIYGHDLVTALKNSSQTSPSEKLTELYKGLSTTITSGGDMVEFFSKRSETLLLDYRLQREKYTKNAETFIDVYISLVIAAPMILMLLLMMIQISGLGLSLSPSSISFLMVTGISVINFVFLMFLHLKQPSQ